MTFVLALEDGGRTNMREEHALAIASGIPEAQPGALEKVCSCLEVSYEELTARFV